LAVAATAAVGLASAFRPRFSPATDEAIEQRCLIAAFGKTGHWRRRGRTPEFDPKRISVSQDPERLTGKLRSDIDSNSASAG
jgi:hypothetical protein